MLVSGDRVDENLYPEYGDASTNVYSAGGRVIDSIVMCQARAEAPAPGPPVETAGPSAVAGPDLALVGGAALLVGGLGAAGWAVLRRPGAR